MAGFSRCQAAAASLDRGVRDKRSRAWSDAVAQTRYAVSYANGVARHTP